MPLHPAVADTAPAPVSMLAVAGAQGAGHTADFHAELLRAAKFAEAGSGVRWWANEWATRHHSPPPPHPVSPHPPPGSAAAYAADSWVLHAAARMFLPFWSGRMPLAQLQLPLWWRGCSLAESRLLALAALSCVHPTFSRSLPPSANSVDMLRRYCGGVRKISLSQRVCEEAIGR